MEKNEMLLNEYGLEIARQKLALKLNELMKNKDNEEFKEKILECITDRDEIEKGNIEVIKKYWEDVK